MKKKLIIGAAVAGLALLAGACGGSSSSDKTATPAAKVTPAATSAATKAAATSAATKAVTPEAETTVEPAELANHVVTVKKIMNDVIAKANAGDVQGTKDTEATMDVPLEAIVKATRAVDAALADSIEKSELAIEAQADASTTDLKVIAAEAQKILPLLDQVVTTLKLPAAATTAPTAAELAADITSLKKIMNDVITKANAGDLQGTKDTEGTMDVPLEAVVTALRKVDATLADSIEKSELAIEAQADASTTDLKVIAAEAQKILSLLDQAATKLK